MPKVRLANCFSAVRQDVKAVVRWWGGTGGAALKNPRRAARVGNVFACRCPWTMTRVIKGAVSSSSGCQVPARTRT